MPLENPWTLELLKWHGHDSGGVRVPFQAESGNPLGSAIETDLLKRLRTAAHTIVRGEEGPRAIFLVGGPGNGKSEAVQVFLEELGSASGCGEALKAELELQFRPSPICPSVVHLEGPENEALAPLWKAAGKLIVIQDASASEDHAGDASAAMVSIVEEILHASFNGVMICCLNRGLLARAIETATDLKKHNARHLLEAIASRTGLGLDALGSSGRECWPMTGLEGVTLQIGAWPLDLESLAHGDNGESSALEKIILKAVDPANWTNGCEVCPARHEQCCPFYQNASDLADADQRAALLKTLRSGEIATGQRWNFRDSFSLVAALLVGKQGDFTDDGKNTHPCHWVQSRTSLASGPIGTLDSAGWSQAMHATFDLTAKLYPHVLFAPMEPVNPHVPFLAEVSEGKERSRTYWELLATQESRSRSYVETYLSAVLSPVLSPELFQPGSRQDDARRIENSFSQALELGVKTSRELAEGKLTGLELRYLGLLQQVEAEWDLLARESSKAGEALRAIRKIGSAFSKRSLGTRRGWHAKQDVIDEYIATLRTTAKLSQLRIELEKLLGRTSFEVDAMSGFGRVDFSASKIILKSSDAPRISIERAPGKDDQRPSHDMPSIILDGMPPIPLTFALFEALKLRREGCKVSSLPPVLATVLGKLRQLHSASLGRKVENFVERRTCYVLGSLGAIVASDDESPLPVLEPGASE